MALPVSGSTAADRVQIELLRAAGIARRSALAASLSQTVVELARAAIRRRHPEYDELEVRLSFVDVHYGRELGDRLRRALARPRR
jgi:hypothetical protein